MADVPDPVIHNGPGKYDALATMVGELSHAEGVVVLVAGGHLGSGLSAQGSPHFLAELPELLESLARGIRAQRLQSAN